MNRSKLPMVTAGLVVGLLGGLVGATAFAAELSTVPAEEYVEDYCAAAAKYVAADDVEDEETQAAIARLDAAVTASNNGWTPELAAATRDALLVAMPRLLAHIDTLLADSRSAGAPKVHNGVQFAQTILRLTKKYRDFEAQQLERAKSIRVDSEIGFAVDI